VYKDRVSEIADLRQPVLFDIATELFSQFSQTINFADIAKQYNSFNLNIRSTTDAEYIPLTFKDADALFSGGEGVYFTENNRDFLEETGLIKTFTYNDDLFKPNLTYNAEYDLMCGSKGTTTPFRYEVNYRHFIFAIEGDVRIKLAPPRSTKYLHTIYDYETFEFRSPINIWNPQKEFLSDFNKIKCLEIVLPKGKCIYIPAYWYYSIQYETKALLVALKYKTYFNVISIAPDLALHFLQTQNITMNYVATATALDTVK
jgi:hypothetical protein